MCNTQEAGGGKTDAAVASPDVSQVRGKSSAHGSAKEGKSNSLKLSDTCVRACVCVGGGGATPQRSFLFGLSVPTDCVIAPLSEEAIVATPLTHARPFARDSLCVPCVSGFYNAAVIGS